MATLEEYGSIADPDASLLAGQRNVEVEAEDVQVRSRRVRGTLLLVIGAASALVGMSSMTRLTDASTTNGAGRSAGASFDADSSISGKVDTLNPYLELTCTNEYGSTKGRDFFYPFLRGRDDPSEAILVEPYRATTVTIDDPCNDCDYSWRLLDKTGYDVSEYSVGSLNDDSEITLTINATGVHTLEVKELKPNTGKMDYRRFRNFTTYVKYVRREVRELTVEDRESFVHAASTMWKVSTVEGRKRHGFGDRYYDIHYLAIIHNDLAGGFECDFVHGTTGYAFVNAHSAMNLMVEQSIQTIDPRLSLPYWDYSYDKWKYANEETFGDEMPNEDDLMLMDIWESDIFSADFFGSNDFDAGLIADGAWAGYEVPLMTEELVKSSGVDTIEWGKFKSMSLGSCYGQKPGVCEGSYGNLTLDAQAHVANSFGYLRSPWNMNAEAPLIRSNKMCGHANSLQFPDCNAIIANQEDYTDFADYVLNLQDSPHGTVHIFTGGAFGKCTDTYSDLRTTLNNDTIYYKIVEKVSDIGKDMWQSGYLECPDPASCVGKSQDDCTCSCTSTLETYDEVSEMSSAYEILHDSSMWSQYATTVSLTDDEQARLSKDDMLALLDAMCNTDILFGDMATSNSPLDILFFSTHNEVERIFQRKMLSSTMKTRTWPATEDLCPGQKPNWKNLWFDFTFDDETTDSTSLTNEEFLNLLDPTSVEHVHNMNYVYNSFNWTHCNAYNVGSLVTDYTTTMDPEDWMWKA
mmetsp:Transcript_32701/g.86398  ORF Transcript_32701/g.86398 Transcript_32701/m.86398 type:complete len:747 (+) Transcript_32701:94-2334(+)